MDPSFLALSASTSNWQDRRCTSLFECDFIFWVAFFQLVNGLVIQAPTVLWRDLSPFLHNFQNAACKFSSNSNQGSFFPLFVVSSDSRSWLGRWFRSRTWAMLLRRIGLYINLRLITILRITRAKTWMHSWNTKEYIFMFCFSALQFTCHSIWWCVEYCSLL